MKSDSKGDLKETKSLTKMHGASLERKKDEERRRQKEEEERQKERK